MGVTANMTENEIKSELSIADLHAVAARLGCACQKSERQTDNMGIDMTLRFKGVFDSIGPRHIALDLQLKATSVPLEYDAKGRGIILDGLGRSVYEDFRDENRSPHAIVILFSLPNEADEWLSQSEESLLMRRCAYWVSLRGAEACVGESKRIFIPPTQLFCIDQLREVILTTLAKKGELRYAN